MPLNFNFERENRTITVEAKEILEKKIDAAIAKYPTGMKPYHLEEIMSCSKSQVYEFLNNYDIPGAKKLPSLGWRIPRETFLAWWFGEEVVHKTKDKLKKSQVRY
ncbi:hypothetical protein SAMN04515654_12158 [Halanaerobium congolense]|jgi:hypothetical protein|uniref:Helix-turn-helix domain-containing protein n=1 Tax=Halanaerobium congolense TaxID=54121 RepID=A0A1G8PX04_9FIRM|nr:hypothetical protein [Halanaerobium congolense]SDI96963.1 hypothetical protein SAMN04515654_12158 [Halanaerobium congolense]SES91794.1 hypothetical protein SAMN04515653_10458 [Halanaerobium congolense]